MRRSSTDSKDKARGRRTSRGGQPSRIETTAHNQQQVAATTATQRAHTQQMGTAAKQSNSQGATQTNFKFVLNRPQAIVIDLMGVLVCRSFMSSSREFRDYFQHNLLEYLSDNWKQKTLKIMINFFRCSQQSVPDEFKLADREESREEQIKQAKKHIIWKLRNDPTNSALSLFMLGITEWGYKNRTLTTAIYDEVPVVLKFWKEQAKVPVYVGVGSADFLIMVLSNTTYGNLLPYFNGHMNIMDFDGTRANKDFKKLANLLHLAPDKILYLTRFRQDCKRAMESGMQSIIVLRPDFDSHNLLSQLRAKRSNITSIDGTKLARGGYADEASPPARTGNIPNEVKNPDFKKQLETNISTLSLIDDHDETDRYNTQSSQIVEQDLTRYSIIMNLSEIAFK